MSFFKKIIICFFLAIFLFPGCVSTLKVMHPEDAKSIKKLVVITYLASENVKLWDTSGYYSHDYFKTLGGDPVLLGQEIKNFPIRKVFNESFIGNFSASKLEIVNSQEVNNLDISVYPEIKSMDREKIRDYTALYKQFGANTILEISYICGLIASPKVRPSVTIVANVSVINIPENRLLMKKVISSDSFYRKGYTIDEFRANNAELFLKEILEAIQGFAHLVAKEFGIELSLKKKSYWQTEK